VRLLSVDWDFFFPVPNPIDDKEFMYDWGHREDMPFMKEAIWYIRAQPFVANGVPLPMTSSEEENFWKKFYFTSNATLYYADSHVHVFEPQVRQGVRELWNFDAHHDSFRDIKTVVSEKVIKCDSWATAFHMMCGDVMLYYPSWGKPYLAELSKPYVKMRIHFDRPPRKYNVVFDKVFLCRSGAWTPSWIEDKFWGFIENCPVKKRQMIGALDKRVFDTSKVHELIKAHNDIVKLNEGLANIKKEEHNGRKRTGQTGAGFQEGA